MCVCLCAPVCMCVTFVTTPDTITGAFGGLKEKEREEWVQCWVMQPFGWFNTGVAENSDQVVKEGRGVDRRHKTLNGGRRGREASPHTGLGEKKEFERKDCEGGAGPPRGGRTPLDPTRWASLLTWQTSAFSFYGAVQPRPPSEFETKTLTWGSSSRRWTWAPGPNKDEMRNPHEDTIWIPLLLCYNSIFMPSGPSEGIFLRLILSDFRRCCHFTGNYFGIFLQKDFDHFIQVIQEELSSN